MNAAVSIPVTYMTKTPSSTTVSQSDAQMLIFKNLLKFFATRYRILRPKCIKYRSRSCWGAHSAPLDELTRFKWFYFEEKKRKGK